ncbi:MAG: dethiobiotin synthase [Gammaproteobacteria bacterium]|nr:dethiobiotin synthase [Gammaproteobacteria bacterium]
MNKGLFVTGTDTGIGKTVVSSALITAFNKLGFHTTAMKPIASGAKYINGQLVNEDALLLQQAASESSSYELINPYVFEPAIAPHLAARQVGIEIELSQIKQAYQQLSSNVDITVVEGVGGWLVPINKTENVADLATCLDLPVILVVGMRLGCINHALLTSESIQQKGANLIGWVANVVEADFSCVEENIETLNEMIDAPLLGVIPFQGEMNLNMSILQSRL